MDILEHRYEDRFQVTWNIDPEIEDCMIVKISLQPLIENAIYHGIKPKDGAGMIAVSAKAHDSTIELAVADDGVGLSRSEVERLNEDLSGEVIREDRGIGLSNVNQRHKLIFGAEYGLEVESPLSGGARVRIVIPIVR